MNFCFLDYLPEVFAMGPVTGEGKKHNVMILSISTHS